FEASSNFFQGGSVGAQSRAASYAEEAAKAKVQNSYMDILEQIRMTEEQVTNKQRQMQVLVARQSTTTRTKELYQEQYKLGTRTVVDLLNAEQAIHSANMEIENNRYDIYANLV
ncbi:TolC family protein, partial [bacterium LRH843]|nr:TolC family protein [bacterium LRH843]